MLHRQELSDRHVTMRAEKCRKLLQEIAEGTLPNLVFTDKKFNIQQAVNQKNDRVWASSSTTEGRIVTRRQNPQSVMVWAAVTAIGRSLLLFIPTGVKLNSEQYVSDILEGCLLPWAEQHFKDEPWILQQDLAPSHGLKFTQSWILRKIPSFINKIGLREAQSKPIGLLHLVHLGEKSELHSSSNLGVPEGQTDKRVGRYTSRNATCHMRLVSRQIESRSQEQRELYWIKYISFESLFFILLSHEYQCLF